MSHRAGEKVKLTCCSCQIRVRSAGQSGLYFLLLLLLLAVAVAVVAVAADGDRAGVDLHHVVLLRPHVVGRRRPLARSALPARGRRRRSRDGGRPRGGRAGVGGVLLLVVVHAVGVHLVLVDLERVVVVAVRSAAAAAVAAVVVLEDLRERRAGRHPRGRRRRTGGQMVVVAGRRLGRRLGLEKKTRLVNIRFPRKYSTKKKRCL